jgi:transposase
LTPSVRRTWAPRGRTPVLRTRFNWKRMSMVAALAYAPGRDGARVLFDCQAGSYNDESLIGFIDEIHRELAGEKVTLIWDGLPSHRSRAMRAYLATQRRWLVVERLPAYAPELNPVEALWGNLKGSELANLVVDTIAETESVARAGIERVRDETQLACAFLRHTGLFL